MRAGGIIETLFGNTGNQPMAVFGWEARRATKGSPGGGATEQAARHNKDAIALHQREGI